MKVLSVDDSTTMRRMIKSTVERLEYEVVEAADGNQALAVLADQCHDIALILLDWNMPNKDGYTTLLEIKGHPQYQNIPVIMVTTEAERTSVIQALKAGAANYVTKPFSQEDLLSTIVQCLNFSK